MYRPLLCGALQEHDPPRLCALDLPGEQAEGDDLGEPDSYYFSEHPDELEAWPSQPFHANSRSAIKVVFART